MGKKTNNSLGATATDQAISGASQKIHLRSRKPKFEVVPVGKPKQGIDKKKKDKKKKRKETAATRTAKLLDKSRLMFAEIRANNQRAREVESEINAHIVDLRLMFAEIRANNQRAEELDSEINAHIVDQLNAWDNGGNGF